MLWLFTEKLICLSNSEQNIVIMAYKLKIDFLYLQKNQAQ
jgi:hypothetical protein